MPFFLGAEQLPFLLKGAAAVLINADTDAVLFEKNGSLLSYPASTTKEAVALYVLKQEGLDLSTLITAEGDCLGSLTAEAKLKLGYKGAAAYRQEPDGTHIGIKKGEILSLVDLLKGMLICSGNDAANVIAHSLAGSIPLFYGKLERLSEANRVSKYSLYKSARIA